MKRTLYLIAIALIAVVAKADLGVGDWRMHPTFGSNYTGLVETADRVYYASSNAVYCYDKKEGTTTDYTVRTRLNGVSIKSIHYNFDDKFLAVVYNDSNIDFLYDDGNTVNLPDIKLSTIQGDKYINDLTFGSGRTIVATSFGYVIFNNERQEVSESRNFGLDVSSAALTADYIVLTADKRILYTKTEGNHFSLSDFSETTTIAPTFLRPIDGNRFFFYSNKNIWIGQINDAGKYTSRIALAKEIAHLDRAGDYWCASTHSSNQVYTLNAEGEVVSSLRAEEQYARKALLTTYQKDNYWLLCRDGITNLRAEAGGGITVISDLYKPNALTADRPFNMLYNTGSKELYVADRASTRYYSEYNFSTPLCAFDGYSWQEFTPEMPNINPAAQSSIGTGIGALYSPVFDPDDSSVMYAGTWFEGVYKFKDNKPVAKYDWTNSPLTLNWACICPGVQFDTAGNLWVCQAEDEQHILCLPRAKLALNNNVTAADWIEYPFDELQLMKSTVFFNTKLTNVKLITDCQYGSVLFMFTDNGTVAVTSDDKRRQFLSLPDQDERYFEWKYINCFAEDRNGHVWMGTDNGVVEFNPEGFYSDDWRINHIKVPREDGTDNADYLLEGVAVRSIAVDGSNRKWIGTASAGVLLVNSDGSKVLKQFNTDNSYLPDNCVETIVCDPNSNSVYFGTPAGLVEYGSDAVKSAEDFSEAYAYPNPVAPDYYGLVTITNLVDNSLVKIADAFGNVVYTGRSEGGMMTWDCNSALSGRRVASGVYYVYMSSSSDGSGSKGAVAKILVLK